MPLRLCWSQKIDDESLADAARQASCAYDCREGLEAWMELMSVNSDQTAQRPGRGPIAGV